MDRVYLQILRYILELPRIVGDATVVKSMILIDSCSAMNLVNEARPPWKCMHKGRHYSLKVTVITAW